MAHTPYRAGGQRFYADLAEWWPPISPPEEYAEEAAHAAGLLSSASIPVRDVLELGSGGGHNAVHLKARFAMTLVDPGLAGLSRGGATGPFRPAPGQGT